MSNTVTNRIIEQAAEASNKYMLEYNENPTDIWIPVSLQDFIKDELYENSMIEDKALTVEKFMDMDIKWASVDKVEVHGDAEYEYV